MGATAEQQKAFIDAMIESAAPVAVAQRLPAAALVACGAIESGYGLSKIYDKTHCPFNLQKPDNYTWVHCRIVWLPTLSKMDASGKQSHQVRAPFCVAEGTTAQEWLADAARIWCEWILGWPQPGNRAAMLALRDSPLAFAKNLHKVGFGDPKVATLTAQTYEKVINEHRLIERCAAAKIPSMPVPQWLPGWWRVAWRGQTFYYHFNDRHGVTWTSLPPISLSFLPTGPQDSGAVTVTPGASLSIAWSKTGSVEKFSFLPGTGPVVMDGTWNGVEPVQAAKMV